MSKFMCVPLFFNVFISCGRFSLVFQYIWMMPKSPLWFQDVFRGFLWCPFIPRVSPHECCFFIVFLVFSNICHRCPMFFGHSPRLPALSKPCFLIIYLVIVNAFQRFLMLSNYCTSLPALTSLAFLWYILLFSMLSIGFQRFQIIARVPPH